MSPQARKQETERSMLDRLNVRYGTTNGNGFRYARAEHVKLTAGFDSRRICDYMAMDLYPGYGVRRGPKLHGHEVKVSRADWLSELKDPTKAQAFARYCDYWWLVVAAPGIVHDRELPAGWGLMVAHGRTMRVQVEAPRLEPEPLPRDLQATFARGVVKTTMRLGAERDRAMLALVQRMGVPRRAQTTGPSALPAAMDALVAAGLVQADEHTLRVLQSVVDGHCEIENVVDAAARTYPNGGPAAHLRAWP